MLVNKLIDWLIDWFFLQRFYIYVCRTATAASSSKYLVDSEDADRYGAAVNFTASSNCDDVSSPMHAVVDVSSSETASENEPIRDVLRASHYDRPDLSTNLASQFRARTVIIIIINTRRA